MQTLEEFFRSDENVWRVIRSVAYMTVEDMDHMNSDFPDAASRIFRDLFFSAGLDVRACKEMTYRELATLVSNITIPARGLRTELLENSPYPKAVDFGCHSEVIKNLFTASYPLDTRMAFFMEIPISRFYESLFRDPKDRYGELHMKVQDLLNLMRRTKKEFTWEGATIGEVLALAEEATQRAWNPWIDPVWRYKRMIISALDVIGALLVHSFRFSDEYQTDVQMLIDKYEECIEIPDFPDLPDDIIIDMGDE